MAEHVGVERDGSRSVGTEVEEAVAGGAIECHPRLVSGVDLGGERGSDCVEFGHAVRDGLIDGGQSATELAGGDRQLSSGPTEDGEAAETHQAEVGIRDGTEFE